MRRGLAILVLALAACSEDADPLDPATLRTLSRQTGTAVGTEFSGHYQITFSDAVCDECPPAVLALSPLLTCAPVSGSFSILMTTEVVHADGVVELEAGSGVSAIGPVDADGTFSAGAVMKIAAVVAEASISARVDGAFDLDGPVPTFTGELISRARAKVGEDTVGCEGTRTLHGVAQP